MISPTPDVLRGKASKAQALVTCYIRVMRFNRWQRRRIGALQPRVCRCATCTRGTVSVGVGLSGNQVYRLFAYVLQKLTAITIQ